MMLGMCAHMLQVLIYGAYKKPRELNWPSGLFLVTLVFGFALTGYLLPWDQKGLLGDAGCDDADWLDLRGAVRCCSSFCKAGPRTEI